MCEAGRPGEEAALLELADLLLGTQQGLIGSVAETYLDEQAALTAERRENRRTLLRALLAGFPVLPSRLEEAGVHRGGLVLAMYVAPLDGVPVPPALPSAADSSPVPVPLPPIAARRRLRRVQGTLERAFGSDVLAVLEGEGGHVVVPHPEAVGADRGSAEDRLPERLLERLQQACGAEVTLAVASSEDAAGIAQAGRTADEVLRIARRLGRGPGIYRLGDVLLEFHLSRSDESSRALAGLLDPIHDRPELVETLRTYLDQQQDRRATARILGLHPNTVDNRLTRVGELIGADVTSPRGFALALTAFTLRDLRPEES
jgi:hypothetical protein